jgi:hypothetical protein
MSITVNSARKLSFDCVSRLDEVKNIEEMIRSAALQGHMDIEIAMRKIPQSCQRTVMEYLKKKGFRVDQTGYGGSMLRINW